MKTYQIGLDGQCWVWTFEEAQQYVIGNGGNPDRLTEGNGRIYWDGIEIGYEIRDGQ